MGRQCNVDSAEILNCTYLNVETALRQGNKYTQGAATYTPLP